MYLGNADQNFGHITYAQHGDDLMLLNIFKLLEIEKPGYLDLGAHHPTELSNTRLLYERGSRGVNVEANPVLIPAFLEERPEDLILNVGVGPVEGIVPFLMYGETSGRNTFSEVEAESVKDLGLRVATRVNLPVTTLDKIVVDHLGGKYPELLTCDIEGFDFEVLDGADFSNSFPIVVCVETRRAESNNMRMMMLNKGYFCYCRTGANLIFVHRTYIEKVY